jgi:tellurite resistance protein TerC
MIYVFGSFLIFTGIKLLFASEEKLEPEKNSVVRLIRRFMKLTPGFEGQRFFVRKAGKLWATLLFVVLVVVETTDVVFALDSIPAIFGIALRSSSTPPASLQSSGYGLCFSSSPESWECSAT